MAVYVGRTTSSLPASRSSSPRSRARSSDGLDFQPIRGQAAVEQAQPELGCSIPAGHDQPCVLEKRLEVDIPDPGHVLAVRDRVVQGDHEHVRHPRLQRAHDLVRPRGILDQQQDDGLSAGWNPLEASEGGVEALEARPDVAE